MDETRNLMTLPPNQNAEHGWYFLFFFFTASALLSFVHHNFTIFVDLNVAFQQSAIRSTAHLDEFFENFQVRLDQKANDIFNGYKSLFIFVLYSLLLFFVLFCFLTFF